MLPSSTVAAIHPIGFLPRARASRHTHADTSTNATTRSTPSCHPHGFIAAT